MNRYPGSASISVRTGIAAGLIGYKSIKLLIGDNASYPALRIFHITLVSRNDMDMQVSDGLTCGSANIDPDIVAIGVVLVVTDLLAFRNQPPQIHKFLIIDVKITGEMAVRNNQEMSFAGGMTIPGSESILALNNQAPARFLYTETAVFTCRHRCSCFTHRVITPI